MRFNISIIIVLALVGCVESPPPRAQSDYEVCIKTALPYFSHTKEEGLAAIKLCDPLRTIKERDRDTALRSQSNPASTPDPPAGEQP